MDNDTLNEDNVQKMEKQIINIFKRLKNFDSEDYMKIMSTIEFYKSKYFIRSNKPKKSFREYLEK